MIGFRATDDDEPESLPVIDGTATTRELSEREEVELFVETVAKLRELGATEVRIGGMRASFPMLVQAPQRVPVGEKPRAKPAEPEQDFPDQPGDTAEDRERRKRYRDIAKVVGQ